MKGLLIKDLKLLKNQRTFLLLTAAIGIWFLFSQKDGAFAINYVSAMIAVFTVSTVSYDELNNGMQYLFTLPVSRGCYVLEKYIFGTIMFAATIAIMCAAAMLTSADYSASYENGEFLFILLSAILTTSLILSITIPIQLKFGAEKSRIAYLVFAAGIFIIGYGIKQIGTALNVDFPALVKRLMQTSQTGITIGTVLLALALTGISLLVSVGIMKRKQF